ncbi:hypothetical protein A9Q99_19585 [Gammaproteobacteria bacterium 45_16_T64]|nr:hypothetical protein A9Q99_19585 [Gammaproteobacteria bacterium 45_16_T64]
MLASMIAKHKVKQSFVALNNHDLQSLSADWHDDIQFMYPGALSVSGTVTGKPEVSRWFDNMMMQFPEIRFSVNHVCIENLFDMTGTNNVVAQWGVELTNKSGIKVENVGINLIKIRHRKVVEIRDFFYYPERLPIGWEE